MSRKESSEVFIGIDVHKRNWVATIIEADSSYTKTFLPDAEALAQHLQKHHAKKIYYSVYEAGFTGFSTHRALTQQGLHNKVVSPADIPSSNKFSYNKTDIIDSRQLAHLLQKGLLPEVHVPHRKLEEFRALNRQRFFILRDLRRAKNRITGLLFKQGIVIPADLEENRWSKEFVYWLRSIYLQSDSGKAWLTHLLESYLFIEKQLAQIGNQLRAIARRDFKKSYYLLRSIPGIGPQTAITILTELGDIDRFANLRKLNSFIGISPMVLQSGNKRWVGGLTRRGNRYLRTMLVEASWSAIQHDAEMAAYFKKHHRPGTGQKAIIKVARKLVNRISYVLKNQKPYQPKKEKLQECEMFSECAPLGEHVVLRNS